jgi:hypothetical protein
MSANTRDELANKAKFEIVWDALKRLGIPAIVVNFSGEGDSGQIDDTSVIDVFKDPVSGVEVRGFAAETYGDLSAKLSECMVVVHPDEPAVTLISLIDELTEPLISNAGVNWWDNDGGFGDCAWYANANQEPPRITVSISEKIVSTVEHRFEFDRFGLERVEE